MARESLILNLIILAAFLCVASSWGSQAGSAKEMLVIQGKILDSSGMPLEGANIIPYLNGKPYMPALKSGHGSDDGVTGRNGLFSVEMPASEQQIKDGKWSVKITRPSFKPTQLIALDKIFDQGKGEDGIHRWNGAVNQSLKRHQGTAFWIALIVFIGVYILIAFDILHRTLAAFLGATVLLLITHTLGTFDESYNILTYEQAMRTVDWNVIFLLMGMMIIVGVLKVSGVFQWLAYKSFQVARGQIFLLSSALCIVTATVSAFLDNVTTMLLLTPVTMEIALVLGVSPFVFLLPEILASNFGGTATLIGDPPNIMIGSYAGLTFNDFVWNLTPVVIAVMVAQIVYNKFYYAKEYHEAKVEDVPKMISFLKEKYRITDSKVLNLGGAGPNRSDIPVYSARLLSHGGQRGGPLWRGSHNPAYKDGHC